MTGDQKDMYQRLSVLVPRWFGDLTTAPLVSATLQGIASVLAQLYSMYLFAKAQTRLLTMTGGWLDMFAGDFFGGGITRNSGELDDAFRARIRASLFLRLGTRAAVIKALQTLTGRTPIVIEPACPTDTLGYGVAGGGYGAAGYYGSTMIDTQFFVIAFRPIPFSPQAAATDAQIYAVIDAVRAAGRTAWVNIQN